MKTPYGEIIAELADTRLEPSAGRWVRRREPLAPGVAIAVVGLVAAGLLALLMFGAAK